MREQDRSADCLATVGVLVKGRTAQRDELIGNLLDHLDWVLGAWVFVGDHRVVGILRGSGGHARLADRIALAGDAEDEDQASDDVWPKGLESQLERWSGGGGVDDDGEGLALIDRFHASGDGPQIVQCGLHGDRSDAEAPGCTGGEGGVAEVVLAGHGQSGAEGPGRGDDSDV